jgi:hypothetical protein
MSVAAVTQTVATFFEEVLGKTGRVIAVESEGERGWRALVETTEESEYMRHLGKSDMLGVYEVHLDAGLEIVSYSRKALKERTALETSVG